MNLLRRIPERERERKKRQLAPRRARRDGRAILQVAQPRSGSTEPPRTFRSLRRRRGLLLVLRALPLLPVVVLVRPRRAQRRLGAEGLLLGRDGASLLLEQLLRQRDDLLERVLRDVLRLSPRGVALLCLALPGKDHELALVGVHLRQRDDLLGRV